VELSIRVNSRNKNDLRQLEALVAVLKRTVSSRHAGTGRHEKPADKKSSTTHGIGEAKLKKLLTRQKTGHSLKKWVQNFRAGQQVDITEIGRVLGWRERQVVAWLAKLGSTQKTWGIAILRKHAGNPVTYSMPRPVFKSIQRILAGEKQQTSAPTTPKEVAVAE